MLIYKIFRGPELARLIETGETDGAPVDIADGYIHFSTAAQVGATAEKHFAEEDGLHVVAVEADTLGDALKWEPSRGGDLFPHLYRKLTMADIAWHQPLPRVDGRLRFPEAP